MHGSNCKVYTYVYQKRCCTARNCQLADGDDDSSESQYSFQQTETELKHDNASGDNTSVITKAIPASTKKQNKICQKITKATSDTSIKNPFSGTSNLQCSTLPYLSTSKGVVILNLNS